MRRRVLCEGQAAGPTGRHDRSLLEYLFEYIIANICSFVKGDIADFPKLPLVPADIPNRRGDGPFSAHKTQAVNISVDNPLLIHTPIAFHSMPRRIHLRRRHDI